MSEVPFIQAPQMNCNSSVFRVSDTVLVQPEGLSLSWAEYLRELRCDIRVIEWLSCIFIA